MLSKNFIVTRPFYNFSPRISKSSSTITSAALETETLSLVRKLPKLLQKRAVNIVSG